MAIGGRGLVVESYCVRFSERLDFVSNILRFAYSTTDSFADTPEDARAVIEFWVYSAIDSM